MDLSFQLFNGASFHVAGDENVAMASIVLSKDQVKTIWPIRHFKMRQPELISLGRNGTATPPPWMKKKATSPK